MKKETYPDLFNDGSKPVDFKTILFEYLLHWRFILLCLVLSLVGAYFYLRHQTPVYRIASTVLIKQGEESKGNSVTQMAWAQNLGSFSMANNFDNEVEVIQSYTLVKKVVKTLGLYINYELEQKFNFSYPLYKGSPFQVWMSPDDAENLPSLLGVHMEHTPDGRFSASVSYVDNDEECQLSKSFDQLPAVFITPVGNLNLSLASDSLSAEELAMLPNVTVTVASPSSVADGYKGRLSATPTSEYTSIVQLLIHDTNRLRGIDFLNTLVTIYNNEANEDKNQVAMRTAEFIDERIRVINEELGTTETELADYKQRSGLTDLSVNAQLALQENTEYDQKRAENTNQLRLISFLRTYIENPENIHEVIPVNVGLTDVALTNIISQYNELLIERKRLLRTSKPNSPAVIHLDTSIAASRNSVMATVESLEKALQITRKNLDVEAGKFRSQISNAPKQERELRDISRQQEIKSDLYLMLLQKREENAITLAAKANNGRVVEEPRAGGMTSPNRRNTYMVAFLLGLMFPVSCIWLMRSLRFKIEGRADIQRITDATIVGDIPLVKDQKSLGIVVRENRNGLMEETFRNLRTNLQYMLEEGQKVILCTSTASGEGKSFNAVNLATSFAFMGKKTVVVGLDIRNPRLTKLFGISNKDGGITEYLVAPSATDLLKLCQPSEVSANLFVLPCGTIPPNPTELVARPSLEKAIQLLKEHFDYIILDTAPIGMVTDTRLIARIADLCVYICRADYTLKNEFELIQELENDDRLPRFCVLVNGIDMDKRKNGYYYGYGRYAKYGKYGYAHKYGNSYGYCKSEE